MKKKSKPKQEPQKPLDFTDRAVKTSKAKRIQFLLAIGKQKPTKKPKKLAINKLTEHEYIAQSLLKKVVKYYGGKFKLRATKFKDVGKKAPGVVEVEVSAV